MGPPRNQCTNSATRECEVSNQHFQQNRTLKYYFFGVPHLATCIFLSFRLLNKPGLGAGINPGMALTPLPSRIGWDRTHDLPIVSQVLYR